MTNRPSPLLLLYGLFAFWTYEIAFFVLLRPAPTPGGEFRTSDPVARAANITVLLGLLVFAARRRGFLAYLGRHAGLPALIVCYCLCSALWSLDPVVSMRRAVSLATCFLFGYFALAVYGPRGTIRVYGWSLFIAAIASWAAVPLFHSRVYDLDGSSGVQALNIFHGVFTQKNELSVEMLMGFCCWTYLGIVEPRKGEPERLIWPLAILTILAAMLYGRGTTSLLASLLVSIAVIRLRWRGWRLALVLYAALAAGGLVLASVIVVDHELLFAALGKDSSLTGRLPLWIESAHAVLERPALGWGYNAFWNADSLAARYIWQRIGWPAPNAHNGLLELGLDFGLVGGVLYLAMMLRITRRMFAALGSPAHPEAKFLCLLVLAMLIESLDEGTTAWPDALSITTAYGYALTSVWHAQRRPAAIARLRSRPTRAAASASENAGDWLPE